MQASKTLNALLLSLACAAPCHAAVLSASTGNAVTDYSGVGRAAFDLDLHSFAATGMEFVLDQDDLSASVLHLNAIVRNLTGAPLQRMTLRLEGIGFAGQGSVTPAFGSVASVSYGNAAAAIQFGAPEYAEFHFGNPLAVGGNSDWLLDLAGRQAGDRFRIVATVPEPATATLMLASLFLFSVAARARDKRK